MLTVKAHCQGIADWNKEAEVLIRNLENTIEGIDRLISKKKENIRPRSVLKSSLALKDSEKADPQTIKELIHKGIYNLRKSVSPSCKAIELNEVAKPSKKKKTGTNSKTMNKNLIKDRHIKNAGANKVLY